MVIDDGTKSFQKQRSSRRAAAARLTRQLEVAGRLWQGFVFVRARFPHARRQHPGHARRHPGPLAGVGFAGLPLAGWKLRQRL